MADDLGAMTAVGSFGNAFLEGRRQRLQQDLEQQKYELAKKAQADAASQNQYHLETERAGTTGEQGTGGWEFMDQQRQQQAYDRALQARSAQMVGQPQPAQVQQSDQPPAPDISNAQGQGILTRPPGSGFIAPPQQAQGSPMSTVPSTNAQMNPGSQPQRPPVQHQDSKAIRMFQMGQQAKKLEEARGKVNEALSKQGQAHIGTDANGDPVPVVDDLGPQSREEINNLRHGQRSAEMAVAGKYDESMPVKTARGSQTNMAQMIDAYKNPSPYADASLVLNAYKIKFPQQSPDVNSIEELQHSQSVPDQWKAQLSKALNGEFDQSTRDNLLRDGISTYRANVSSLGGEQSKALARSKNAGVNGKIATMEPSVMKTYEEALGLQKQIGPYVPPTQRGGIINDTKAKIAGLLGIKTGSQSQASGGFKPHPQDAAAVNWAKMHPNDPRATAILQANGVK